MDVDNTFSVDLVVWYGMVKHVAERDGISEEEASTNLGNLFTSDEVQAQIATDIANSAETKLSKAQELLSSLTELLAGS